MATKTVMGLKLWIELIRTSNLMQSTIDKKFRKIFSQNISRFDVLSQLDRTSNKGLTIGELGLQLIASKGNITGLVNRMVKDGLLVKKMNEGDRRSFVVRMTFEGEKVFNNMTKEHNQWINEIFSSMDKESLEKATTLLSHARHSINESKGKE